jgi:hypothetical protein
MVLLFLLSVKYEFIVLIKLKLEKYVSFFLLIELGKY